MLDLLIVGAGPAGAAAAIEAVRAGLSAVTVDRARFPRDKCCGDGLTTTALRQLEELGLDPRNVPSWTPVEEVRISPPDGRAADFPLPAGRGVFAATARRAELDAALVAAARAAGAEVRDGAGLVGLDIGAAEVTASLTGGDRLEARHLVAADGMWSPTRKLLGCTAPGYRGEWHAFRQYFSGVAPEAAGRFHVWFEPELLPGYAWSFPLPNGTANVGFGIHRNGRLPDMKAMWAELLDRPRIRDVLGPDAEPEGRLAAWPIPARLGRLPLTHGPVLFAGDAAAAADPMTGEGIAQAIETGRLAVRCIVDAGGDPTAAATRYEAGLRGGMMKDQRLAGALSAVLRRRRGAAWGVGLAAATGWTRRHFARWLVEDYPRAVVVTPRRWQRRLFSGDGAYVQPTRPAPLP